MKLLFVTREDYLERRYGIGRSLMPIAEALSRRGHMVRYLCRGDRSSERSPRERHRALGRLLRPLWSEADDFLPAFLERIDMGRFAATIAARDAYTHVHLHDPWIALGYRLFSARRARHKSRWGIAEHGFGSYCRAVLEDGLRIGPRLMGNLRRLERYMLAHAHWVTAPTQLALQQLSRDLGSSVIPPHWHAIPHPRPALRLRDHTAAREALGWSHEALYVIGIGRLVPLKRFSLLIDAVASLEGDVRLVLLGDGDTEALVRHAREVGLKHPLDVVFTDDVGLYLSAADIYVSTSSSESFGLANLEALFAGVPAVCTAVGGVPEVVGDAAWLIPEDGKSLPSALEALAADRALRAQYASRGRARAELWPTADTTAEGYERIYLDNVVTD